MLTDTNICLVNIMAGRKPLPDDEVRNIRFTINLSALQREYVRVKGGAEWVADLIQKEINADISRADLFPNVANTKDVVKSPQAE